MHTIQLYRYRLKNQYSIKKEHSSPCKVHQTMLYQDYPNWFW